MLSHPPPRRLACLRVQSISLSDVRPTTTPSSPFYPQFLVVQLGSPISRQAGQFPRPGTPKRWQVSLYEAAPLGFDNVEWVISFPKRYLFLKRTQERNRISFSF